MKAWNRFHEEKRDEKVGGFIGYDEFVGHVDWVWNKLQGRFGPYPKGAFENRFYR